MGSARAVLLHHTEPTCPSRLGRGTNAQRQDRGWQIQRHPGADNLDLGHRPPLRDRPPGQDSTLGSRSLGSGEPRLQRARHPLAHGPLLHPPLHRDRNPLADPRPRLHHDLPLLRTKPQSLGAPPPHTLGLGRSPGRRSDPAAGRQRLAGPSEIRLASCPSLAPPSAPVGQDPPSLQPPKHPYPAPRRRYRALCGLPGPGRGPRRRESAPPERPVGPSLSGWMRNPCAGALPLDGVPRVAYTGLMRGWYGVLALALLALPTEAAEINVRVAEGRVDLSANAAPVADVLDRLSKQTGMKVVYEGPPPRQLVSVSLAGRTPAEAVVGLLEGLGLNYMLLGDPSGTRVQTLMMAGAAPATPSARSANANPSLRMSSPAPGSSPDAEG